MGATLEEGAGTGSQGHIPRKTNPPKEKTVWVGVPSPPHGEPWY